MLYVRCVSIDGLKQLSAGSEVSYVPKADNEGNTEISLKGATIPLASAKRTDYC